MAADGKDAEAEAEAEDACVDAEPGDEACVAQRAAEVQAEKERCKETKGQGEILFNPKQIQPHNALVRNSRTAAVHTYAYVMRGAYQ